MGTALEGRRADQNQVNEWIESFHRDGYLVVPELLSKKRCERLIADLQTIPNKRKKRKLFGKRMFEHSAENLALFDLEPMVGFAEQLIGGTHVRRSKGFGSTSNQVHVIHNNSFALPPKTNGLAGNRWHQDDTPHLISLDGQPITGVRLNVLAFTINYYLTDVLSVDNGPTQVIPGSHLFGQACEGNIAGHEEKVVSCLGPAGTAVCFNNQTWHRGSRNDSDVTRMITQITYGKRLVGHKFGTIMNYQMPGHVTRNADERRKRLLGFLGGGAYS